MYSLENLGPNATPFDTLSYGLQLDPDTIHQVPTLPDPLKTELLYFAANEECGKWGTVAEVIKECHISDEKVRIDLAKKGIKQIPALTLKMLQDFEISDQKALFEILKIGAETDPATTAFYVDQAALKNKLAICLLLATKTENVLPYFENFHITRRQEQLAVWLTCYLHFPKAALQHLNGFTKIPTKTRKLLINLEDGKTFETFVKSHYPEALSCKNKEEALKQVAEHLGKRSQ